MSNSRKILGYIDVSRMRLGDRMASAWYAQGRAMEEAGRFAVLDKRRFEYESLSMTRFFPETFFPATPSDIVRLGLEEWAQGNLWLTASNAFQKTQRAGYFEHIPEEVRLLIPRKSAGKRRVLIHVLDDALYNFARNWRRKDAQQLIELLEAAGYEVVVLNPGKGKFMGSLDQMLGEMLSADLFIGGDTGPSHVFALLCPDTPQIAIYPDMTKDQAAFAWEQQALGVPLPWNSLPFKAQAMQVVQLTPGKARYVWITRRFKFKKCDVGVFNPDAVLALVKNALG